MPNPHWIPLNELSRMCFEVDGVHIWGEDIIEVLALDGTLDEIIRTCEEEGDEPGMYADRAFELAERFAPIIKEWRT